MIGSVSPVGSYSAVQRYAQVNPAAHGTAAAEKSSVLTARKSFDLETPVQAAEAVKPVVSGVSGNVSVDLTTHKNPEAAELSARMRMSSDEEKPTALSEQEAEAARRREELEEAQKAEEKREAYLEELKEQEAAREERVEALREEQSEDEPEKAGTLELDRTSALLQNYQMNNLMQDMLSARTRGEDTEGYSAAIDALLHSSQSRVQFSTEETKAADAHRYYQHQAKRSESVFGAVA